MNQIAVNRKESIIFQHPSALIGFRISTHNQMGPFLKVTLQLTTGPPKLYSPITSGLRAIQYKDGKLIIEIFTPTSNGYRI